MAVLNLDGLQTRYADPTSILREIAEAPRERINALLQKVYQAPVREQLIGERITAVKRARVPVGVSTVPAEARRRAGAVALPPARGSPGFPGGTRLALWPWWPRIQLLAVLRSASSASSLVTWARRSSSSDRAARVPR